MSGKRGTKDTETFLTSLKVHQLQAICAKAALAQTGLKADLVARILPKTDHKAINFAEVDLDELSYLQIFAKCVAEDLPTVGTRIELQKGLQELLGRKAPDKTANKSGDKNNQGDFEFLKEKGLNTEGNAAKWKARKKLFADGKHDKDLHNMEREPLQDLCDLYEVPVSQSRKEMILNLEAEWATRKARRGGKGDGDRRGDKAADGKRSDEKRAAEFDEIDVEELDRERKKPRLDGDGLDTLNAIALHLVELTKEKEVRRLEKQAEKDRAGENEKDKSSDGKFQAPSTDKDGKALAAFLVRLPPHLVPLSFNGDFEQFGLYLHRALEFCSETDEDAGVVALYDSIERQKESVLDIFTVPESHAEGERSFCSLVYKILGWAGSHEVRRLGIEDAKLKRAEQTTAFTLAFDKMQTHVRKFARNMDGAEGFYRDSIQACIKAAFGVVISRTAIKNLTKQDDWREKMEKKWGQNTVNSGGALRGGNGFAGGDTQARPKAPRFENAGQRPEGKDAGGRFIQGGNGGFGQARHRDGEERQVFRGGASADGNGRRPRPGPPDPTLNPKTVGLAMPVSCDVAGSNTKGMSFRSGGKCEACGGPHFRFECPVAFAQTYPGKAMPGWKVDGERDPYMWNDTEITAICLEQWQKMQRMGFFKKMAINGKAAPAFAVA
jgi:hypothetical protein